MSGPFGNVYDKYGSTNPVVKRIMKGFFRDLHRALDQCGSLETALEVGCGDGALSNIIRTHFASPPRLTALDPGHDVLVAGKNRFPEIRFLTASIYDLPFADRQFDLVLAPEVLEHLDDPEDGLNEVVRVAAKHVILSVPWEPWWRVGNILSGRYLRDLGNTPGHVQHWSRSSFLKLITRYLDIQNVFKPFPWTMVLAIRRC